MIKKLFYFGILLLMLSSCQAPRQTNLMREGKGNQKAIDETKALEEYRVCSGDVLNVSVLSLNQETNTLFSMFSRGGSQGGSSGLTSFTVYPDGTIDFPYLVAPVYVKGKTTLEIKFLLEDKLKTVTNECAVQVSLGNRYFSIIGESGVGSYFLVKEKMTIYQALAMAGDISLYGDRKNVKIIRQTETGTLVRTFNVQNQDIINSEYYYIQPNDVIYVQPMGRQFWGISSFGSVFSLITTFLSLGTMVYNFVK